MRQVSDDIKNTCLYCCIPCMINDVYSCNSLRDIIANALLRMGCWWCGRLEFSCGIIGIRTISVHCFLSVSYNVVINRVDAGAN